jgi:hypothetical protein
VKHGNLHRTTWRSALVCTLSTPGIRYSGHNEAGGEP